MSEKGFRSPYAGILLGLGVGIALAVALDNIAIGIGVGTVFVATSLVRLKRDQED